MQLGRQRVGEACFKRMVAAHLAHWYGGPTSLNYIWPFAATFGGIAQFAAALWGYRARDGLATAMHGTWGAFWMGFGILFLLNTVHAITVHTGGLTPSTLTVPSEVPVGQASALNCASVHFAVDCGLPISPGGKWSTVFLMLSVLSL